ncbi:NACHT domain-containing protein [Lentzea sp. JNUCC 0626]|uniref:NACHT domain-containing protein n=1 Tax=Lentzea sp. JNUCC 0626 TaxID=3367513 RepID=UPI00374A6F8E
MASATQDFAVVGQEPSLPSIESAVIRVVVDVSDQLSSRLADSLKLPSPSATSAATEALFADLDRRDVEALEQYLGSPDFATVVAQKRVGNMMGKASKDQLREGLRLAGLSDHPQSRVTDLLHDAMVAACQEVEGQYRAVGTKTDRADIYNAATTNTVMLRRLKSSARIHVFAARMRDQVAALHSKIRMPHIGVSRAVRYDQLYVTPTLKSKFTIRLGSPGHRVLVQGDPGAGKSTLATKFAYDVATDGTGRVPFLLVLRQFADSFAEGGHDLLHYLEKVCQEPYNVKPPRDGIEYLLRTGRAVVILDGLDELVQIELRRRVVSLVEGFAHLYPLVPILVTARKVGYEDAPLNDEMFAAGQIAEFDDDQVADYVSRWFSLDEATSPVERERLITSFLEDSRQIRELRSNALLLTLLCAMYSSDRYLPHNLAEVYERCALMLFEQWDSKRGIELPIKFHGRLRGAVQHLAWKMFSATESGKAQKRARVINHLTEYLDRKLDDHDVSVAAAEEFLAYCTGRAWILTDVGANEFGFTHRTFLEYFAAEHLVRTHRTAEALWAVLKPTVDQWDVVAQIVLQLFERNFEGGADELLEEALRGGGLRFATRALRHVAPSDRVVRSITVAALEKFVRFPLAERTLAHDDTTDFPIMNCVIDSSPMNREAIQRAVTECFGSLISEGEAGATLVVDALFKHDWPDVRQDLCRRYGAEIRELRKSTPWAHWMLDDPELLDSAIRKMGAGILYSACTAAGYRFYSAAFDLLTTREMAAADSIAITMTFLPAPWTGTEPFDVEEWKSHRPSDALGLMLTLPYLEYTDARRLPDGWDDGYEVPAQVRDFLRNWERGEFSLLEPDPEKPLPLPAQH